MKMEIELKVLTLNCWGIPGISSDRRVRMRAIADELSTGAYDFVTLQEVWSNADYDFIARKCLDAMPYSHYFRSGVMGSGLCVLSKGPITDLHFQRWPLNGYAHKIQHGDWFGGKGVGLCKILYRGLKINVYTAHLHAEYNETNDEYLSHRLCQALDFSQFVNATGETSDVNLVMGDFNAEPKDLAYQIIRQNANLCDSFLDYQKEPGSSDDDVTGATCEHPRNTYTPKKILAKKRPGKRLDYILYSYNPGGSIHCTSSLTPLDKCPNKNVSFSDHEAVVATLLIRKTSSAPPLPSDVPERARVLQWTDNELASNLKRLDRIRYFYVGLFALICCLLLPTAHIGYYPDVGWRLLITLARIVLTVLAVFCAVMGFALTPSESNTIVGMRHVISVLLATLADATVVTSPSIDEKRKDEPDTKDELSISI